MQPDQFWLVFVLLQVIVSALTTFLNMALFDALTWEKIFIFFLPTDAL